MNLLLAKIVVSLIATFGITTIAERVSTRFAGILLNYPLAAAIVLFFVGIQEGPEFASTSAIWTITGLSAEAVFSFGYYAALRFTRRWTFALSYIFGFSGFFISALLFRQLPLSAALQASLLLLLLLFISYLMYRKIPLRNVENSVRYSHTILLFRATLSTSIILLITGLTKLLGSEWIGIFAGFPTNILVIFTVMQYHYDREHVLTLIKGLPAGTVSLLVYLNVIAIVYPLYGIYWGTLLAYAAATGYLMLYEFIFRRMIMK